MKSYDYDLKILDENGSVLYEYPDIGSETMRGMLQGDALIWVCTERWTSIHRNGYAEGCLKECNLLLIDLRDGAILFQEKAGLQMEHDVIFMIQEKKKAKSCLD